MDPFSFIKNLFISQTFTAPAPVPDNTAVNTIEFPNTYKATNLYANIPPRPADGMSGSQFGQSMLGIPATQQRDDLIFQQCVAGNIPSWMNNFKHIIVNDEVNVLQIFVMPDYLCVGNDYDFLRTPLNPITAQRIATLYNCMMPTKHLADIIWQRSDLKLNPQPIPPSPLMANTQSFITHNILIETQRAGRSFTLITGTKKDIIIDKQLITYNKNVGIYGWFYQTGQPIQGPMPNCVSHSNSYCDYSHGVRFIARRAILNDQEVDLYDILKDDNYANLISTQGSFDANQIYTG